jgi:hypothetical protein
MIGESPDITKINITLRRKECDVAHTSLQSRRWLQRGQILLLLRGLVAIAAMTGSAVGAEAIGE